MHKKRDMLRAVMEGVVYSLRDCLEVLREMEVVTNDMAACGGGGSSTLWRSMLADTFGISVKTVTSKDGPALGAAILAGVGAGIYKDVRDGCARVVKTKTVQEPDKANGAEYEKYYSIYKSLYPALKEQYKRLAEI